MLPRKINQAPVPTSAFGRALARMKEKREAAQRLVRIGFIVDATGSREHGWEQAQTVQGRMFDSVAGLGRVALHLVHFGGNEITDHGWSEDTTALAARMAAVRCRKGLTQILPALRLFFSEEQVAAEALILVGDAFEEDAREIDFIAHHLKARGTRVFSFFEGDNGAAEAAFRRIAEATGGRFARLGDDLPLGDLCAGVALLTAGGEKAIRRLKNEQARKLLLTGPAK